MQGFCSSIALPSCLPYGFSPVLIGQLVHKLQHHLQRKTEVQNHTLRSCGLLFTEFDGESPRSKFKQEHGQTAENGHKILGDDVASISSLVPHVKNLRQQNGLEFGWA